MNNSTLAGIFLLISFLLVSSCATSSYERERCIGVSEARINSSDGAAVTICGYFKYEFENINIYQSKKDTTFNSVDDYFINNCLSVGTSDSFSSDLEKYKDSAVKVFGKFTMNFCPEKSFCPASCSRKKGIIISKIEKISVKLTPRRDAQ